jgi:hypothetical protein
MAISLRDAVSAGPIVTAPGAYDGLTARLVARHGFPAVYMTGAGTSVSQGYPDYGLLTMTEMVENAARMTAAAGIPVIADADTGYGNELNVVRAVQSFARAGVAAIHIEDQTFPKRCGHLAGKEIVERDAWLRKIRGCRRVPAGPGDAHHRQDRRPRRGGLRGGDHPRTGGPVARRGSCFRGGAADRGGDRRGARRWAARACSTSCLAAGRRR